MSKTNWKRQNLIQNKTDDQNLENILRISILAILVFLTWILWSPHVPLYFFYFCNRMDVKKSRRVPPFTFFGTVTPFKFLIFCLILSLLTTSELLLLLAISELLKRFPTTKGVLWVFRNFFLSFSLKRPEHISKSLRFLSADFVCYRLVIK